MHDGEDLGLAAALECVRHADGQDVVHVEARVRVDDERRLGLGEEIQSDSSD